MKEDIKQSPDITQPSKNTLIEMYLETKYDFRYNSIKCKPEYRVLGDPNDFRPIDKYFLNSLKRELYTVVDINTSTTNLNEILASSFSERVNPIQQYFRDLDDWDEETDYISELSETVTVRNAEKWREYLEKWLVAVVANAMQDIGCQNHTCLVITGEQGKFKTTWLDNLCPKALKLYLFTGKIDPTNKDSLTYISEFLFINIDDQLRQLNKKDENELKNLITTPAVKYRRPYDVYIQEYPHSASFMASINGNDFLTDPSGSRRFLPFEALNIDINAAKALDMDKVWAQAYNKYMAGFNYWFTQEEVEELNERNQEFMVSSLEEQFILKLYQKPSHRDAALFKLQTGEILSALQENSGLRLSQKRTGEALTQLGYEKFQVRVGESRKWVWALDQKVATAEEILEDVQSVNAKQTRLEVQSYMPF
ncbi:MAG: virulence protein [Bacteroidia bacterium]|nr:virulence protein [Bacteroidia bacterium]